jgi:hypothetical protein
MVLQCCGRINRLIDDDRFPFAYDPKYSEVQIRLAHGGYVLIAYCPFCGSRFPESQRSMDFLEIDPEELAEIDSLSGVETVDALTMILGESPEVVSLRDGAATQYVFRNRWKTVDLIVLEDGGLTFLAVPKAARDTTK